MAAIVLVGLGAGMVLTRLQQRLVHDGLDRAVEGLLTMQALMDNHFLSHRTYATVGQARSPCEADLPSRTFGPFTIRCAQPPEAAAYTLLAEGRNTLAEFVLSIDQANRRATIRAPKNWPTCPTGWATRVDSAC